MDNFFNLKERNKGFLMMPKEPNVIALLKYIYPD